MEDEKAHHNNNNNLLELKLPSSSSSNSNPLLITPPDADALLAFFNHGDAAAVNNDQPLPAYPFFTDSPMYDLHPPSSSSSSSFMAPPGISPSSFADPAHALISSNGVMGGKRRKMVNKGGELGMEKPREVIHVRAKRGQATDTHSLAERVRRERINEKLKVLQDLVPGCYKTMGMAVMLDVIINYVRNLQNQIEFLSMKLSDASMFYDFNSPEAEAMEAFQRTNPCEAMEMERMMRDEGFYQGLASESDPPPADHDPHFTWPF